MLEEFRRKQEQQRIKEMVFIIDEKKKLGKLGFIFRILLNENRKRRRLVTPTLSANV
jgi:hypothetical protein